MVGRTERVLVEERNAKTGLLSGRTGGNIIVDFPGPDSAVGTFAQVKITQARNWILKGELARVRRSQCLMAGKAGLQPMK